jgi:5-methyltetrahydropteroyltriglutamate--homocysteine methyltransferase
MTIKTAVSGFPRIGENRELKKALENYWSGRITEQELEFAGSEIRKKDLAFQKNSQIDLISVNDFSFYDNMLDSALMLGAVPPRFTEFTDERGRYFAMARGSSAVRALEMTKWFNTNYHYLVPELNQDTDFSPHPETVLARYKEAASLGILLPKINMIGPLSFLRLARDTDGKDPLDHLDRLIPAYVRILEEISLLDNLVHVQLDEPVLVKDQDERLLQVLPRVYDTLVLAGKNIRIIVATYFEHAREALPILAETGIWGMGLDYIHGPANLEAVKLLKGKKLLAGVVDGKNIWSADIDQALGILQEISRHVPEDDVIVSSSCSLLHVPYTVRNELPDPVTDRFSFAREKVREIALISSLFHKQPLTRDQEHLLKKNRHCMTSAGDTENTGQGCSNRSPSPERASREHDFAERIAAQKKGLDLPLLPATTIGSFPQTSKIRGLRRDFKKGLISLTRYEAGIKEYIDYCVAFQEEIGLDVLVHGEPERNDMVEYFGEMLEGFYITANGWVQSYGSRCVKPPVIHSHVSRPGPMTVKWITHAQSRTSKPVKGMLTGPVTILNWSFVRNDRPVREVARQIALALREEVRDLQAAGIRIIQVDEAAFKEGYPLRKAKIAEYEAWAVENFRLTVSVADKKTQIHTHMCYSEFNDIIKTIEAMDADVITVEMSRSNNDLLQVFKKTGYDKEIGPGVYDIHSPRIPSMEEMAGQIWAILEVLPMEQVWVNPDCGLKTRRWEEVRPALINMVSAAKQLRPA